MSADLDRVRPVLPRPISAPRRSLGGTAVVLGALTVLGAAVIGFKAYHRSREVLLSSIYEGNLSLAQTLAAQLESAPPATPAEALVATVAATWASTHHRYADSYLCVIGPDGKLLHNTRDATRTGSDVSTVILTSPRPDGPQTIRALVAARENYAGLHTNAAGERQVAAFAYTPRLDALLAVHIPLVAVDADVRSALLPWALGYTLVILGLLPLSLAMLQRAATQSQTAADDACAALAESAAQYRALTEQAADAITTCDGEGRHLSVNQSGCELFGYSPAEFSATTVEDLIAPDDLARLPLQIPRILAGETVRVERKVRRKDGSTRWVDVSARLLADGRIEAIHRDISTRKAIEQELKASQAQLLQAQKMEAVGRLAGGIAHDFNNLLTAISGYAELLRDRLKRDDSATSSLEEIMRAASRATTLTRQLLAYSRRQILQPRRMALNTVLRDTAAMLHRVIGEDIEIHTSPGAARDVVRVDPVQIEQVLLNLAVNARDAMPQGGKLVLETSNVTIEDDAVTRRNGLKPGDYAMIAVSDTGCGMDRETLLHAFEPFFTTKEVGKGTGLGLSTVEGIVHQTGGQVSVYSQTGIGTTFKVYLPCADSAAEPEARPAWPLAPTGNETVLVVEDDPAVQTLARDILARQGYHVLTANGPEQALALAARGESFALLLTDIVMPHMNGRDLAKRLQSHNPALKIVFMSGYTAHAAVNQDSLDPDVAFLPKPFTVATLAQHVRAALDRV